MHSGKDGQLKVYRRIDQSKVATHSDCRWVNAKR